MSEKEEQKDKVPYDRFQEVVEEKNKFKEKASELENKLADMESAEDVKASYETKLEKMRSQNRKQRKEFALKEKALAEGVRKKALDDVTKVADLSLLDVTEDGDVQGVEDTINQLKENKDYLFGESSASSEVGDEFKDSGEESTENDALREAMDL